MNTTDFVILLVEAAGGSIQGRTVLQKRAFFVSVLSDLKLDFRAHYYGPFSPSIDAAVSQLKSLGFIDERTIGFGSIGTLGLEVKRYDYVLTDDGQKIAGSLKKRKKEEYGKIVNSLKRIEKAGNPNYSELSIAAKAFFILTQKAKPMARTEIMREAQSFDWRIDDSSLQRTVSFLEKLGLVNKS